MRTTERPPVIAPPPSGGQLDGDQMILLQMLHTVQAALNTVVHVEPSLFPANLEALFKETWDEVEKSFDAATATLGNRTQFEGLYPRLQRAGLTGAMLRLKSATLEIHVNRFGDAIADYQKPILTYLEEPTLLERVVKWARPAFRCMNSFLGSLASVLPGIEIAKEYKEHVELTVDIAGQEEKR